MLRIGFFSVFSVVSLAFIPEIPAMMAIPAITPPRFSPCLRASVVDVSFAALIPAMVLH
jgi:hypothetical protein